MGALLDQVVIQRLDWDTEWFGFPIATVMGAGTGPLPTHEFRCLYCLCEPDHARWAEGEGFELIDIRVELDWQGTREAPTGIREEMGERDRLQELARDAFADSRFYQDERFPRERVDAMFGRWLERSSVVLTDDDRRGFITYDHGHIGLVGVSAEARGAGLGVQLVNAAQARNPSLTVVTQGKNIAAQRLYQKCGFRTSAVKLWYHRWSS